MEKHKVRTLKLNFTKK